MKQDVGQTISPALGHNSHLSRWEERLLFLPAGWDIVLNNSSTAFDASHLVCVAAPFFPADLKTLLKSYF